MPIKSVLLQKLCESYIEQDLLLKLIPMLLDLVIMQRFTSVFTSVIPFIVWLWKSSSSDPIHYLQFEVASVLSNISSVKYVYVHPFIICLICFEGVPIPSQVNVKDFETCPTRTIYSSTLYSFHSFLNMSFVRYLWCNGKLSQEHYRKRKQI